jgi:hypothetical protein
MTQDMENLRKKSETELQYKMEGQSSRIEQTDVLLDGQECAQHTSGFQSGEQLA